MRIDTAKRNETSQFKSKLLILQVQRKCHNSWHTTQWNCHTILVVVVVASFDSGFSWLHFKLLLFVHITEGFQFLLLLRLFIFNISDRKKKKTYKHSFEIISAKASAKVWKFRNWYYDVFDEMGKCKEPPATHSHSQRTHITELW